MSGLLSRVFAVLLVVVAPFDLAGQALSPPAVGAALDVVSLDVSVLSRDRRPIRGLRASDFVVTEDGQPRRVVAFAEVGIPASTRPATLWLADRRADVATNDLSARSLNVIVMDDAPTQELRTGEMSRRVARRVIESLSPADLVTVVFASGSDSGGFTGDRDGPLQKISAFRPGPGFGALSRCPMGDCVAATLTKVTNALSAVPDRRKTVFLIATNGVGGPGSPALRTVLRLAQEGNVMIHVIDPGGLADMSQAASQVDPSDLLYAMRVRHDALRDLAVGTGGRAVLNMNDPSETVPALVAEGESYYLIGFERSREPDNGRLHPIQVAVNRKDVTVRARRGYYGEIAEQSAAVRAAGMPPRGLESALLRPLPSAAVALTVAASPMASLDLKKAIVALTVGVRQRVAGDVVAEEIRTVAAAFDPSGYTRGWRQERMAFTLPTDSDGVVRYEVLSRLELEPGRYDVRVALTRLGDGSLGSVFMSVDIPNYRSEPLSMSGLVLASTAQPPTAAATVLEDILPFVPTSLREFRRGDRAQVFVRTYQGGATVPRAVTLTAQVTDAVDANKFSRTVSVAREDLGEFGAAESVLDLPLDTLEQGMYRLRVEATTADGGRASRELRFVVN
jgi:VWFA-related protein